MHHRGEFGTDLGVVLSYIKASVDKKELKNLISSDERFKCFDREAFDVINDAADSKTEAVAFIFQEGFPCCSRELWKCDREHRRSPC